VKYPNAIAAVAYYRNVAPNTPMNVTSMAGLDAVTLGHSNKSGELFKDTDVGYYVENKLIENVIFNDNEFEAYKERVIDMLKQAKVDVSKFADADYINLLKGEKVN
jgi:hypothetical protein